ncbi:MAG: hypothetical protein A2Y34_15130 [Spirochaetes bacterium GWC1_27_15]|nr:MAG: hypothetical protein A2Y34_15130 [Spirochaetes bacterium GWC1_27_15]
MNKIKYILLFIIPILIVILATFFASSNPDGLEWVAEKLGFLHFGKESFSILGNYSLINGIIGIFTTAAILIGVGFLLNLTNKKKKG